MKKICVIFLFATILTINYACTQSDRKVDHITPTPEGKPLGENNIKTKVKTYQNSIPGNGWGYDIYADGKLYIHQPHIPAVNGNRGFQSQQNAEKAGNFAAYKIGNNIMPPTISVQELDSLGVIGNK